MHQLQMGWPPKSHTCIVKICCQKWSKCDAQSASLATFSSDLLLSQIHRNPFLCLWKSSSKDTAKNHSKNAMGFKSPQHAPRARQPHPGTSVAMVADSSNPKFVFEGCLAWYSERFSSYSKTSLVGNDCELLTFQHLELLRDSNWQHAVLEATATGGCEGTKDLERLLNPEWCLKHLGPR